MNKDPDPKSYERLSRVGRLLNQAQTRLVDALDQELKRFQITAAQYVVLSTLAVGRADSAAQVCKELSYDPGAMTRMLDRLEQKHLISRVHSLADRRTAKLVLTDQGKAIFPDLLACANAVLEGFLGGFSPEELVQFEGLLGRMLS